MPNYTKLEEDLLSDAEIALSDASRQPRVAELNDAELLRLIDDLKTLLQAAGPFGEDGQKTRADLLKAALNRTNAERRKRGLKRQAGQAPKPATSTGTGTARAKRVPATTPRKPAGRKVAETRKDLRTGSRRVAKTAKPDTVSPVAPTTEPAAPAPTAGPAPSIVSAAPVAVAKPAAAPVDKEAAKLARKAEKKAAKEAEKAERKAARQAERMARKAEKDAAKAQKAARKAEKDALKAAKAAAREQKAAGKKKHGKGQEKAKGK